MKWTRMFTCTSLLVLFVETAGGQLNQLTPREAIQVLGKIPEVAQARKHGFCPVFSASYGDTVDRLGVMVRYGCGPYSGQWINSYGIDLRTGVVSQDESKKPIQSPEAGALARTLLKQANARILSEEEARCLAWEAAKELPGWNGPGHEVSVEPFGAFGLRFTARLRVHNPPIDAERYFTVDRATARVHDDETGMELVSTSFASLASRMLTLHRPSLLSEWDALQIAREIPEVKAQAGKPCSVFYLGGGLSMSWEGIEVYVRSQCDQNTQGSSFEVEVNPKTGAVTDPHNGKPFVSPAAARVAQERLEALEREKIAIRETVNAACRTQ